MKRRDLIRHLEIPDLFARKICRTLEIPGGLKFGVLLKITIWMDSLDAVGSNPEKDE